jgi:hypothetical protein
MKRCSALVTVGSLALGAIWIAPAVNATVAPSTTLELASDAEPLVPVWATLGAGKPVAGATVEFLDAAGVVVATATTNDRGTASILRSQAPSTFTVRVSGGTLDTLGRDVVLTSLGESRPSGAMRVVHVDPVTTIAARVAKRMDIGDRTARRLVMKKLGFPNWVSQTQVATARGAFDARAFTRVVEEAGGPREAMAKIARGIANGGEVPSLSAVQRTVRNAGKSTTKSASSRDGRAVGTATYIGVQLMAGVVGGIASGGTSFALGSIFGGSDPTATALKEIAKQLEEINKNLLILQGQMQQMLAAQAASDYNTIASSMSLAVTNTNSQWSSYNWFMNNANPASPNYQATVQSFAEDFQKYLQQFVPLYSNMLSSAGSMGLIEAMYKAQRAANPWWNQTDLTNMQGTLDYYGTLQAQASALMTESWQYTSPTYTGTKTPDYVSAQVNANYKPLNDNIYKSMPTPIESTEVVNYTLQRAYRLAPTTAPNSHVQAYGRGPYSPYYLPSKCSAYTDKATYYSTTPSLVLDTTVKSWWSSAIADGQTLSDNGDFSTLATVRPAGGTTLQVLKNGAPSARILVTSASVPWISAYKSAFAGWGWCGGTTVQLDDTSKWSVNLVTYEAQDNPYGVAKDAKYAWPVGVLSHRAGNFKYVTP